MRYLIVAHDAGGAEIVSAWVKANPQHQYCYLLQGPAITVFSRKIPLLMNAELEELASILPNVDYVLTGTSWGSDLERYVIQFSRSHQVKVVSYLDHWNNYIERFLYNGIACLPDEIWVGDEEAEFLAKSIFNNTPIHLIKNEYFHEIRREFENVTKPPRSSKKNLLYICEPISACNTWKTGDKDYLNYTEFTALQYLFQKVSELDIYRHLNCIKIRLHPSEKKSKYQDVLEKILPHASCEVIYSENSTLLEDYAWTDWVVGVSSMALVIANILHKVVFTCVPENAITMKLPLKGILPFNKHSVHLTLNTSMMISG